MNQEASSHQPYPTTPGTPFGDKLTLYGIFNIIKARWLLGSAVASLCAGLFAVYFLTREPVYESTASLVIEINEDRVTDMQEVVDTSLQRGLLETIMNTHRERLLNRAFAERIVTQLSPAELEQVFVFAGIKDKPPTAEPTNLLRKEMIEIEWIPDTQVIEVSTQHTDPVLAKKITDLYTNEYVALILEHRQSSNDRAVNFIDGQAEALQNRISESEKELQAYRARKNLVSMEDDRDIIGRKLTQINEELTNERVRLIGLQSTFEEIQEADEDREKLLTIEEIGSFEPIPELVMQLKGIEKEYDVLQETYLSEHPVIKKNRAERKSVIAAVDRNIDQAIERIQSKFQTAERRESQLASSLQEAENEAQDLDRLAIRHNVLQRRLDTQKETYDQLMQRLNETSISSQLSNTNVRILEPASFPDKPEQPNVARILLASGLTFMVVLMGFPLLWETVDTRLKTFAEIESFVGKPVMGHIQAIRGLDKKTAFKQMEHVGVVEAFRGIFAELTLQEDDAPIRIMVSSTAPGEGKSFVSANLAFTCARHGLKTVLVDADLRRSSLHKSFDLKNTMGLKTWFNADPKEFKNLGLTQVAPELDLLPAGGSSTNSTELIRSQQFRELLDELKERYDAVIIDTPPVGPCPDALLIARSVDHTLFVARQKANSRHKIRSAVHKLEQTSAPVIGLVLNRIIGQSADATYANYRSEYGFNYGYSAAYYSPEGKQQTKVPEKPVVLNHRKARVPNNSKVETLS